MTKDGEKQKNLLSAIDFEINKIDDEASKAGWNFWILLGSIATLGWLLLEELGGGIQDWKHSLTVFLIFNLAFEVIANLKSLLYPTLRSQFANRFFIASRVFGSSRLAYIFVLFRNLTLSLTIYFVKDFLIWYQILIVYYAIFFILALFILLTSFIDLPITPSENTFSKFIGGGLVALITFIVLRFLTTEIFTGKLSIAIIEYKIGSLIFGISFLVPYIISLNQNTYQKMSLVNIRRDLLLGNLDINEAKRQTEILLLGMQADDYLKDDIKLILELLNQNNLYASKVDKEFASLTNALKRKKIAKLKIHELMNVLSVAKNAFHNTDKDFETMTKSNELLDKQVLIFQKKSILLERIPVSQNVFFEKIIDAYKVSHKNNGKVSQSYRDAIEILDSINDRIEFLKKRTQSRKD